jgi:hypothetical protein
VAEIAGFSNKDEAMNGPLVPAFVESKLRQSIQDIMDNVLRGQETVNCLLWLCTKSNETCDPLVNTMTFMLVEMPKTMFLVPGARCHRG